MTADTRTMLEKHGAPWPSYCGACTRFHSGQEGGLSSHGYCQLEEPNAPQRQGNHECHLDAYDEDLTPRAGDRSDYEAGFMRYVGNQVATGEVKATAVKVEGGTLAFVHEMTAPYVGKDVSHQTTGAELEALRLRFPRTVGGTVETGEQKPRTKGAA